MTKEEDIQKAIELIDDMYELFYLAQKEDRIFLQLLIHNEIKNIIRDLSKK